MTLVAGSAESPPSLAEQAYQLLEHKLVTLELAPGSVISEGQLIDMTGLGRTPVREAMQRLAYQEMFDVMPRKGLLVTPVSRASPASVIPVTAGLNVAPPSVDFWIVGNPWIST